MSLFGREKDTQSVFKNRDVLMDCYHPDEIVGRDKEKDELADRFECLWDGNGRPKNLFISGNAGTGKTVTVRNAMDQISADDSVDAEVCWLNCQSVNGATALMLSIANGFRDLSDGYTTTGYSEKDAMELMFSEIEKTESSLVIVVLDELDTVDSGLDKVLYHLPRANSDHGVETAVSLVSISNAPDLISELPADRQSSISDAHISFTEYNATELTEVLKQRAELAFRDAERTEDGGVISPALSNDVIPFLAAKASKNGGDARMARDTLLDAGEIARSEDTETVTVEHAKQAVNEYHASRMVDQILRWKETKKMVLYALLTLESDDETSRPRTKEIHERYVQLAKNAGSNPVSKRQTENVLRGFVNQNVTTKQNHSRGTGQWDTHSLNYDPKSLVDGVREVIDKTGVHRSLTYAIPADD